MIPYSRAQRGHCTSSSRIPSGDSILKLNSGWYKNAFGNEYRVQGLRYYVSDFVLRGPDGETAAKVVHLVDAERPNTLELHVEGFAEGHFHDLVFTFGLSPEWNHTNHLPSDPHNLEMVWPQAFGGGYHYMKLEGEFLDARRSPAHFRTHLGALRQAGMEHHHHFTVTLTPHITIVRNTTKHVEIIMDVNEWYTTPNDVDLETHADGIMENTDAQNILQANGSDAFNLGSADSDHPKVH